MLTKLIDFSVEHRFLVLFAVVLVAAMGFYSMGQLPIDAVPDIMNVQVQVLTDAPGLGPVEVEQFVTFPVEAAMSGLPRLREIRSVSKFGLSVVTVVFEDGMDIYLARQLVGERLSEARESIPEGYGTPEMAPITTGLGEIFMFTVEGEGHSLMDLRTVLDWQIAYQLRSVPGVVEVNTHGGKTLQYQVQLDPNRLFAYRLSVREVFEALQASNLNVGSGYLERNEERILIRGEGLYRSLDDIRKIVVRTGEGGAPVYLDALGRVEYGPAVRRGAGSREGAESVHGIVLMLKGENARVVVERVKAKIKEIETSLPEGVTIEPFYDRAGLVNRTIKTVITNLSEGALLVVVVLLLILGNLRGGLLVASAIPLSMLVAFTAMLQAGVSGNLMSLGAIDFGLIVDGSVVMIENIVRHMARLREEGKESSLLAIKESAREVARPILFAVGIIVVVYFPILTLQGIEGKMFRPMALTVIFALLGSLVLAFTLMPAGAALILRPGLIREGDTWFLRHVRRAYMPMLKKAVAHPVATAACAASVFAASLVLVPFMGGEFIPKLDEGSFIVQPTLLPSVTLEHSSEIVRNIEKTLLENFPDEIETVASRTGSPELGLDPMGVELTDTFVMLKPKRKWKRFRRKQEIIEAVSELLEAEFPGVGFSYTQPIEMRFNELMTGVRSGVGIKLFGDDLETLKTKGDEIASLVSRVPGAEDVRAEQIAGLPVLGVRLDYNAMARHGIHARDALDVVQASVAGIKAGTVVKGQQRFDVVLKFLPETVQTPEDIANLPVGDEHGHLIPLGQLAKISIKDGPAQVSRELIQRRIVVECNVRGRDIAGFIAEAKKVIGDNVDLPPGYYITWGGTFEHLQSARARLFVVVPLTLLLIFMFLFAAFNSGRLAALIFLNVPLAATGGIFALFVRDLPFSISAGVGFIALFGVAVLNGVVLVSYLKQFEHLPPEEAALRAASVRLRPVLMTAMVASLGFVPMALATSAGAEVQRPLATVVIGGLITSTALTLLVLPAVYRWFARRS